MKNVPFSIDVREEIPMNDILMENKRIHDIVHIDTNPTLLEYNNLVTSSLVSQLLLKSHDKVDARGNKQ